MQLRTHGLWPDSVKPYPVLPLATSTARIRPCCIEEEGGEGWGRLRPLPPQGRLLDDASACLNIVPGIFLLSIDSVSFNQSLYVPKLCSSRNAGHILCLSSGQTALLSSRYEKISSGSKCSKGVKVWFQFWHSLATVAFPSWCHSLAHNSQATCSRTEHNQVRHESLWLNNMLVLLYLSFYPTFIPYTDQTCLYGGILSQYYYKMVKGTLSLDS